MSKERSSLAFILKLDAHARKFITVHSLKNDGKNIITKTFNILYSGPPQIPGGRVTHLLKIPWASQLSLHFLENSSKRFYAKHRLGSAGTRRVTLQPGHSISKVKGHPLLGKTVCHPGTLFLFIKNKLNKNTEAEIARKIRTI